MAIFAEAAAKLFKCKTEDIDIRMITENKEAFMIYQEQGYKISTRESFCDDLEFQLTDKDAAQTLHLGCWIQATKHSVSMNRILGNLIRTLKDTDQAKILLLAVGLGSYAEDMEVAFWEVLARIDKDRELLANAIICTASVYDGAGLIEDLLDLQIINGKAVYNIFVDGIFETVYLEEDQGDYPAFYIYSADYEFSD